MDTVRVHDLKIEVPVEEELLAAVECALVWFEDRARHQDPDHAFGGEGPVEQKLRRAIAAESVDQGRAVSFGWLALATAVAFAVAALVVALVWYALIKLVETIERWRRRR